MNIYIDSLEEYDRRRHASYREKRGFPLEGTVLDVDQEFAATVWVGTKCNDRSETSVLACVPHLGVINERYESKALNSVWFIGVLALDEAMTLQDSADAALEVLTYEPHSLENSYISLEKLLPLATLIVTKQME